MKTSAPPAGSPPPEVIPAIRATTADDKETAMDPLEALTTEVLVARAVAVARADGSGESEARWALVSELHRRAEPVVFEAAVAWCGSDEPLLQCLGADVLGQLGSGAVRPFAPMAGPGLSALLRDGDPNVLQCAVVALGHMGLGGARGIAALSAHADPRMRYAVAFYLGSRDDEAAERVLIALSADPDRDVRDWATFALGSLQTADSAALREALVARSTDPDDEIRGEAILGLARRRDERAVSAVLAELRATASVHAIEAAGELAREIFLPDLERLRTRHAGDSTLAEAIGRCGRGPQRG